MRLFAAAVIVVALLTGCRSAGEKSAARAFPSAANIGAKPAGPVSATRLPSGFDAAIAPVVPAAPTVPTAGNANAANGSGASGPSPIVRTAANLPVPAEPSQPASGDAAGGDLRPAEDGRVRPTLQQPLRLVSAIRSPESLPPLEKPLPAPAAVPTFTLADALQAGLERNPDLMTLRGDEPVRQAALGVAQAYPFNPSVQVQVLPFSQDRNGGSTAVSHYVLLWQTLELAHQGRYRAGAANADLQRTRWNIHQAELLTVAQTERLYVTAAYRKQVYDAVARMALLNEQMAEASKRRFDVAQSTAADASIALIQARTARRQAQLAEANYETALLDLRRQLGMPLDAPLHLSENLTAWQWYPVPLGQPCPPSPLASALAHLPPPTSRNQAAESEAAGFRSPAEPLPTAAIDAMVAARPDVMAARADVDLARSALGLSQANKTPNVLIGPYYQRDDLGTTAIGFRSWTEVPVVNTGAPMVRQRFSELHSRQQAFEQAHVRARLEAQAAVARYERARRMVQQSGKGFIEPLEEEVARVESQFRAGQTDLARVFAARAALVDALRAHLDALNEVAQAAANVTAATGLPPAALIGMQGR